ncbi:MAG: oxidoreductase [Patescibacteria group bacterium]|nr:oxidoreductase [Patescibacteria group bacterium]
MDIDPKLFDYATEIEQVALHAIQQYGECKKASAALGRYTQYASETLNRVKRRASKQGYAPGHFEHGVAPGYNMGKVTVQRNSAGDVERVWERQHPDMGARLEAMKQALEGFKDELPHAAPTAEPYECHGDLLNLYTFTDYHLGMLAWHREGGADWDLQIAERILNSAMSAMVEQSPKAHTALLNIQGDFLHTDGKVPITPAHHNVLDADSRYPKIRRAAIRSMRSLIAKALMAHKEVHVVVAEGNHDEEGSGWLADCLAVFYENEPRVSILNEDDLPFYVFEWGDVMLGVHHGHKVKNEQLPLLFAAQYPQQWGRTKKREVHCGHRHHRDEKEYNGVTIVQHPTLAARDAYAARGGWIADRAAWAMTYHKRFGPVGRVMVTPEMLGEAE